MTLLLAEVSALIAELERLRPLARSCADQGDGLRSPGLDPRVSGGGTSGSVQERLVVAADERRDDGTPRNSPSARLSRAEADIGAARRALTDAWADAHRRTIEEWDETSAEDWTDWQSRRLRTRTPLVLPSDHLEACRVLCDNLTALGPVDDGDGLVADRIRDAHRHLVSALSGVQACLPRRGDDWTWVIPPCTCDEDRRLQGHHPPPCQHGHRRWEPVNDKGDKGCLAHRRAGRHVSSGQRLGLCRWCYDFQRAHGQLPPPPILDHHDAGYMITPTFVAQHLAKRKPKAQKPVKRRQPTRRERMQARVAAAVARISR